MNLADQLKAVVEVAVKQAIEAQAEPMLIQLLADLKKAIPGQIDDMVIEALKPQLLPILKAELLKLADKISNQV